MAQTHATWSDLHLRLRAALTTRLSHLAASRAGLQHHRTTCGEAAAFLLTAEALRTKAGRAAAERDVDAIADALRDEGVRLVGALRGITDDKGSTVLATSGKGGVISRFDAGMNRLWSRGGPGFASPAFDGILPALPVMAPDVRAWTPVLRDAIRRQGGTAASAASARAEAGEDGRIVFVMPDGRGVPEFDLVDYVLNAAHSAPDRVRETIDTYAYRAALRDRHRAKGEDALARLRAAIGASLPIRSIRLYTVNGKWGVSRASIDEPVFIFHAHLERVGETLRDGLVRIILRSDGKTADDQRIKLEVDKAAASHRRVEKTRRARGLEWDEIGLALLARAGVDPKDLISPLDESPARASIPGVSWSWAMACDGRVTIRMPVGRDAVWKHDEIEVRHVVVPRTVAVALVGQPAERIIDDPAFAGATIRSIAIRDDATVVRLVPRWREIGGEP